MYKSVCNSCKKSQTTKMTCHISPRFGIVSIVKVFVGSNFQLRSRILKFVCLHLGRWWPNSRSAMKRTWSQTSHTSWHWRRSGRPQGSRSWQMLLYNDLGRAKSLAGAADAAHFLGRAKSYMVVAAGRREAALPSLKQCVLMRFETLIWLGGSMSRQRTCHVWGTLALRCSIVYSFV